MTRLYVAPKALEILEAQAAGTKAGEAASSTEPPARRPQPHDDTSASQCARCGATDVRLEPDPDIAGQLRCNEAPPFTALRACWQKTKPHCPAWCATSHPRVPEAVTVGGWAHHSDTIQTAIPNADFEGNTEVFNLTVSAWEDLGGDTAPVQIHLDSDNIDIVLDAVHARAFASTLNAAARFADMSEPST